jgi:uncharacterized protein
VDYPDYDPRIDSPPLTDEELAALDALLARLPTDAAMNVEAMDGCLTALLLGPGRARHRSSRSWMPLVWGGEPAPDAAAGSAPGAAPDAAAAGDARPGATAPFPSAKQRKRVALLVLRHLHAIDRALPRGEPHWQPVFSIAEGAGDDGADLADAEDWCAGFLAAVALDEAAWAPLFEDPQLAPLLQPLVWLGADESALAPAEVQRLADPRERDAASRAVVDAVLALQARRAAGPPDAPDAPASPAGRRTLAHGR